MLRPGHGNGVSWSTRLVGQGTGYADSRAFVGRHVQAFLQGRFELQGVALLPMQTRFKIAAGQFSLL